MPQALYSYLAADLVSNQILAELPLTTVQFERFLNGAGGLRATLPLRTHDDHGEPITIDYIGATEPERTVLYVDRGGKLVWSGIIWSRNFSTDGSALELSGQELWSYYRHRYLDDTISVAGWDQLDIMGALVRYAEGYPASPALGLPAGRGPGLNPQLPAWPWGGSGVTRDRTYNWWDVKEIGEAVEQLAEVIDGFEFYMTADYVGGVPQRRLVWGYPRLGVPAARSPLMFEEGHNVLGYSWPEDGSRGGNEVIAIGAGEGEEMLLARARGAGLHGYPLLQQRVSHKDVSALSTLQAHADAELRASLRPRGVPPVTVAGNAAPVLGSYEVGDDVWLSLRDVRHPRLDAAFRLNGFQVSPPGAASDEKVNLYLGQRVA